MIYEDIRVLERFLISQEKISPFLFFIFTRVFIFYSRVTIGNTKF